MIDDSLRAQRTRRAAQALTCLLVALAWFGLVAGKKTAQAQTLTTGITMPDVTSTDLATYKLMRKTGATLTRVTVRWNEVVGSKSPKNAADPDDPAYDWSAFDPRIANAAKAGLSPIVQIMGAPTWAQRCKSDSSTAACNPNPVAFARFARAAATRYDGSHSGLPKIRYWEAWNEPNLRTSFQPQMKNTKRPAPVLYRALLNRFSAAVKGVDPNNLVIGGGLAPLGGEDSYSPLAFARQLLCMQGRTHPTPKRGCTGTARFDIWATNPYTTGGPTHTSTNPDDLQLGDLAEMTRLLRAAKRAGKIRTSRKHVPYWLTEFSWDSKPPDPGGVPMRLLKRWTAHAMFQAWRSGVSAFFWFSLRDIERVKGHPYSWTLESGLYFRGKTPAQVRPKGTVKAFRFPFVAFRRSNGIYFWGKTPGGKAGRIGIRFRAASGGSHRLLVRAKAGQGGIFRGFVRTRFGASKKGSVTATFGNRTSVPFSLTTVKDFYQPPFG